MKCRVLLFLSCVIFFSCTQEEQSPDSSKTPHDVSGDVLGAPAPEADRDEGKAADTSDQADETDPLAAAAAVERNIIVKNAGTDDEVMVSPPVLKNPVADLEALHKGQRVEDFADVKQLNVDGYQTVFFSKLSSFVYFEKRDDADHPGAEMTLFMQLHNKTEAAKGDAQIPPDIRALDGKKVVVPGFMLPASGLKDGMTNDFLLVHVVPSCFFCRIPNVTEWICCTTSPEKRVPFHNNKPVLIKGTLHVGAKYVDNDYLDSIYQIDVESVELLD